MDSPLPFISAMAIGTPLCIAIMAACSVLTPAEDAGLYAADVAACTALSELPTVGPIVALVCPNEEAFAKAALDHAVAEGTAKDAGALDAGVGVAVAAVTAAPTSEPRVAVTRRGRRGKRRLVMYAPKSLADGCQRYADAQAADGGGA